MAEIILDTNPNVPTPLPVPELDLHRPTGMNYARPVSRSARKVFMILFLVVIGIGAAFVIIRRARTPVTVNMIGEAPVPAGDVAPDERIKYKKPDITQPMRNEQIISPLTIAGTVPPGWMFEGTFPIRLVSDTNTVLAEGSATEIEKGSWQSGKPVRFMATLTFVAKGTKPKIILVKDNPSGLPANDETFELPVQF